MIEQQINILFICETKVVNPHFSASTAQARVHYPATITNNFTRGFYTFNNPDPSSKGSGCALIMTEDIEKHLQSMKIITRGRLLRAILAFKNKHKFTIYGAYFPPSFQGPHRLIFQDMTKELIEAFTLHTQTPKHHVILLGDFNIHKPNVITILKSKDDIIRHITQNTFQPYMLFSLFKFFDLHNVAALFNHNNEPTHFPNDSQKQPSTIDFIFSSNTCLQNIIGFHITEGQYTSDHQILLMAAINPTNFYRDKKAFSQDKRTRKQLTERYNIKSILPDQWVDFNNKLANYLEPLEEAPSTNVDPLAYADKSIDILYTGIRAILKDMKIKKLTLVPRHNNMPLHIRQGYNAIHHLSGIISLVTDRISLEQDGDLISTDTATLASAFTDYWTKSHKWIHRLITHYNTPPIHALYAKSPTLANLLEIRQFLITLRSLIKTRTDGDKQAWTTDSITHFITRRNEDISTNQKRMLNSILKRNPRKITLDRIKTIVDGELTYTTIPSEIEKIAVQHYQTIGLSNPSSLKYDPNIPLRDPWASIYDRKSTIPQEAINRLDEPITYEELQHTLKSLPNNKAPGPSGIPYDLIKKLTPRFFESLVQFYNYILDNNIIPSQWQEALLFPIPKPNWWDNDITATRPIVLLDTFRKILTKIINTRLNEYLSVNHILQHNNRAGTEGSSCMEIIFKIQAAITAAKTLKKDLYIMIQDLSKAYDRVDIPLLRLALRRIAIPPRIISFITNLFSDRSNSIIFQDWLGEPYDVLTGIDQGDSICPLLWVIYYDPMFEAINQSVYGGISYTVELPTHIPVRMTDDTFSLSLKDKLLGYLDDTTWLTDNMTNLAENLKIADDFYSFANIKINKHKTTLLTNVPNIANKSSMPFTFGNENININIVPINKGTRILGVYLNANDSNSPTIRKVMNMVRYVTHMLRKKKLTHDHVIYVINKVIIPRIEYLTQHTFLSVTQCNKINRILRSTFKQAGSLPKSLYNSVIHSSIYPHIVNIFDHQIKAQTALFIAQANSSITSDTLKFLILLTQFKFWLPNDPFKFFSLFEAPLPTFNRLENLFTFFRYYNLSVSYNFSFNVKGGSLPISHFIIDPKFLQAHIRSLRHKGIMFLDQLITIDSAYLLDYKSIKQSLQRKQGRIPRWYKFLQEHLTLSSSSGRLNIDLPTTLIQNPQVQRPTVPPVSNDLIIHKNSSKWIARWSPTNSDVLYGRVLASQHYPQTTPCFFFEHFGFTNATLPFNNRNTPRSIINTLTACPGCNLHDTHYIGSLTPKCVIRTTYASAVIIDILPKSTRASLSSSLNISLLPKRFYIARHSHPHYRLLTYNDYLIQHRRVPVDRALQLAAVPNDSINNTTHSLIQTLFKSTEIASQLLHLATIVGAFSHVIIYTDGSYSSTVTDHEMPMGYGWVTSNLTPNNLSHNGALTYFPSSTRAEIMAILTALVILAPQTNIQIHTDSQAAIDAFHKSKHLSNVAHRRFLKLPNYTFWVAIHHIIRSSQLNVTLIKVKAHSGNHFNDLADTQAKLGRLSSQVTELNIQYLPGHSATLLFNNQIPLDRDIRKTIGTIINYQRLDNHLNHQALADIKTATSRGLIDWHASSKWFNHNAHTVGTSSSHAKDFTWKLKCSNNLLPTLDILNLRYPCLIKGDTNCLLCHSSVETNHHFWTCSVLFPRVRACFATLATSLEALLTTSGDQLTWSIKDSIRYSPIFAWIMRAQDCEPIIPGEALLLLRSYVPSSLYRIFRMHCSTQRLALNTLMHFLQDCLDTFKSSLWKYHSVQWKNWKETHHLTKRDFKDYRKNFPTPRYHLAEGQSSRRPRLDRIYTNPFNDYRNFKTSLDYLFILFTSSNFLHSGPFFRHLRNFATSHSVSLPAHFVLFYV